MPRATQEEVEAFIIERGPYRLECDGGCFRGDYDGVRTLPTNWQNVREVQSLRDALSAYDGGDSLFEGRAVVRLRPRSGRPRA